MQPNNEFLEMAVQLAYVNVEKGGRPFGAVVVRDGEVIAEAVNQVVETNDPTAHAELLAIRAASKKLESASLAGCAVFASSHPCPMCMAAMRLAGVTEVMYAHSNEDGAPFGLSTADIYADLAKPFDEQSMRIRYAPTRVEGKPGLYECWRQRAGAETN